MQSNIMTLRPIAQVAKENLNASYKKLLFCPEKKW